MQGSFNSCSSFLLLLAARVSGGVRVFAEDLGPAFRFGGVQGERDSLNVLIRIVKPCASLFHAVVRVMLF